MQCVDTIQQDGAKDMAEGREVALLVNNLGSTPAMEMYIMARAALKYAQDKHRVQHWAVLHVHLVALFQGLNTNKSIATLLAGDGWYWLYCNCCTFPGMFNAQHMVIFRLSAFWQNFWAFTDMMQGRCAPATHIVSPASVLTRLQLRLQLSCWLWVYIHVVFTVTTK
jgi:hypothetical protein